MQDNLKRPFWEKGLIKANSMPSCGAKCKTRGGLPCRSIAMANGRCRMHGGNNQGAPCGEKNSRYKHGLYTKEVVGKLKAYKETLKEIRRTI